MKTPDRHGNEKAQEGCDRCPCGCKYWEHDRCIDCGEPFVPVPECTNANHDYFLRHGVACDCAITTKVVDGKRVDCAVREVLVWA